MTPPAPGSKTRAGVSSWLAEELRPATLVKSLSAGVLIFILEIIVIVSFAALIFSGPLAAALPYGLALLLVGGALLCAVITLFSSYRGSIAVEQDAPGAILALAAASAVAALPVAASAAEQLSTVVVMIVGTTIATALFFLVLGAAKLGGLARFLPYPVMGGFLAGTGWLLAIGGIGVMVTTPLGPGLFQQSTLARWLPGVILGAAMVVAVRRSSNPLVLPAVFVGGVGLFYAVAWIADTSVARLSAAGWLLGAFPAGSLWRFPLSPELLSQANWPVIVNTIPTLAPVLVVSVIALLLNVNGLELIIKRDIDLNHELVGAGLGNLVAGLGGGMVGYHAISSSSLNHAMGGNKRLPGLIMAGLIFLTAIFGTSILNYLPKMILGALLVFLGLSLLVEWVYESWFKFPKIDFLIILLILVVIAVRGFLPGIAVGLVVTIVMFVVSYSRINVVDHILSGADYRSRVARSPQQEAVLNELGSQLTIFELRGFIFFGTANSLFEQVRKRLWQPEALPLRFVLLDLSQVTGLDSTGLLSFTRMLQWAQEQEVTVVLSALSGRARDQFVKGGFREQPGILRMFPDLDHAIEWCEQEILAGVHMEVESEKSLQEYIMMIAPSAQDVEVLVQYMERREVAAGDYVLRQGDDSDVVFFIESGQLTVQLELPGKAPIRLGTMLAGREVGSIGFYLGVKRTASVVADTPSVVYCFSKQNLEHLERIAPATAIAFHRIIVHVLGERVVHLTKVVDALQH